MKSIYGSLLLLSIAKVVTAGPLPTRPVVDVRLDHNPGAASMDDRLPSSGHILHVVSDSDIPSYDFVEDDFGIASINYDSNEDSDLISGTNEDLALRSSNGVAIQRRGEREKVKRKEKKGSSSSTKAPGGGMEAASKGLSAAASGLSKVSEVFAAEPGIGDAIAAAIDVVATVMKVLSKIFDIVGQMEKKSAEERGKFTQETVEQFFKLHKDWNVVITDVSHVTYFVGVEGKDWAMKKADTHTALGKFNYVIYGSKEGVFEREGDGGFENWAYIGKNLNAVGDQKRRLVFSGAPPVAKITGTVCHVHFEQYNKGKDGGNANSDLVAVVYSGNVIGAVNGNGNLGGPVTVTGQLAHPMVFTETKKGDDLGLEINGKKWTTADKALGCKWGKYDHNTKRQGDCNTVPCTWK